MILHALTAPRARKHAALRIGISLVLIAAALSLDSTAALARTHHHYHQAVSRDAGFDRSQLTMMSRGGGFDAPAGTQVTGEIATVLTDNAPIYAGREQNGILLTRVDRDSPVLITGQAGAYYAIAMSRGVTGFIAKTDAHLLNIQTTAPGDPPGQNLGGYYAPQVQTALQQSLIQSAANYNGVTPYVWGGNTASGIDCSGLVKAVYSENGITLPRTAAEQSSVGLAVPQQDLSQWAAGDRMYFRCRHNYIDHTGMYIGNGYFIHSSIHHHGVAVDKVQSPFYWDHLVAVRRSVEVVQAMNMPQGAGTMPSGAAVVTAAAPDFESNQE